MSEKDTISLERIEELATKGFMPGVGAIVTYEEWLALVALARDGIRMREALEPFANAAPRLCAVYAPEVSLFAEEWAPASPAEARLVPFDFTVAHFEQAYKALHGKTPEETADDDLRAALQESPND